MNNKKYYEEHELSYLFQHIQEYETFNEHWRGIYRNVILDTSLSTNHVITYLYIYKICYKKGNWFPISLSRLSNETNIKKPNLSKIINKLEEKEYLFREFNGKYSYKIPELKEEEFLPISLNCFDTMLNNKKLFVEILRALLLSWGNDKLPAYGVCKKRMGNLTRRYYNKLRKVHNGQSDVILYESLTDPNILSERRYITKNGLPFEFLPLDEQLDALFDRIPIKHENIEIETKTKRVELPIKKIVEEKELSLDEQLNALLDEIDL